MKINFYNETEESVFKYERLINKLTELLIDDDDSGETCREALNQVERFNRWSKTFETNGLFYLNNIVSII